MSIETKIVADFYARLFPWIDHQREVWVCRDDGGRALSAIPDLCFYFVGADEQLRVEFKTVSANIVGCTRKQVETWQTPTNASPHLWIGIDNTCGDKFLFWRADDRTFRKTFRSESCSRTENTTM